MLISPNTAETDSAIWLIEYGPSFRNNQSDISFKLN